MRRPPRSRRAAPAGAPTRWAGIHDYGVIGDLSTAALVSRFGSIDWACLPAFSSPSVFGRLLDRRAGGFHAVTVDGSSDPFQRYLPGTNILRTFFRTPESSVTVTDFMPVRAESPGSAVPRIVRIVEAEGGDATVRLAVDPRFDYGRAPPAQWTVITRERLLANSETWSIGLTFPSIPTIVDGVAIAETTITPDRPRTIEITWAAADPLPSPRAALESTGRFWRYWVRRPDAPMHRQAHVWFDWVERSELVLKLLSRGATGAFIAAPTASLPEWIGGPRNWDYRYVWVRDAAFAAQMFLLLGHLREAREYVRWVIGQLRGAPSRWALSTLYDAGDEPLPAEVTLDHWEGYRGSRPVRIGNAASEQVQLDIYGEVLDAAGQLGALDPVFLKSAWPRLQAIAEVAVRRWKETDRGIWEFRKAPAHYVHSKVMGWVAADRGARLAEELGDRRAVRRFRRAADEMREVILDRGWNRRLGSFVQAFGRETIDASVLRLPMTGFVEWGDDRVRSTIARVEKELARGPFVYRYRGGDGIRGPEGAFLLCSFWLVECQARTGERDRALRSFRQLLKTASPLRLFTEEYDPGKREPLGNFPQAFTHIGVLRAALALGGEPGSTPEELARAMAERYGPGPGSSPEYAGGKGSR